MKDVISEVILMSHNIHIDLMDVFPDVRFRWYIDVISFYQHLTEQLHFLLMTNLQDMEDVFMAPYLK